MNVLAPQMPPPVKSARIMVTEPGDLPGEGWEGCTIGHGITFDVDRLSTYFFKRWNPVLEDALLVAGAVEYCDMAVRRPARSWARDITLHLPVHELARWCQPAVADTLHATLNQLTGDRWTISFTARRPGGAWVGQNVLELGYHADAVIPFSEGLDSCSVADLVSREPGNVLARIRLGASDRDRRRKSARGQAFANIPYAVRGPRKETSMRSRGFKFGIISGLAAYLADASRVILPESGQGALGPALAALGQAHPDYRNHPCFLRKLEAFLEALLDRRITYELPRLWSTKGETLAAHLDGCTGDATAWRGTRSCWQQNRHAGVNGRLRQCGICAACLLRRMSIHAAGQGEPVDTYIWENLSAPTLEAGAAVDFERRKITRKMREYAIAGTLHLDHLAGFRQSATTQPELNLHIFQLARACAMSTEAVRLKIDRLLAAHAAEWAAFLDHLGPDAFLREWAAGS